MTVALPKARVKSTGTIVEVEEHEGRRYYLGTSNNYLVHKVDARTGKCLCGRRCTGHWDADTTEPARDGKPLRDLVTCKDCGGGRSNSHPELGG